ncbi:MAG: orotidine-5'-phosphate decarboxylase [Crocinitomicaceae bacterium]|nr:orotidine-5'-phosphate decarboxylase [Crocinitomicaceae bacterium]|tara:strand:- start:9199 stop:10020 length:822 start_codon:yes stop_codon:yes gene_type:complete
MTREALVAEIKRKKSFLCVGLDTDITKIPEHLLEKEDPIFEFNKAIIDATQEYCVAYKPNLAFYESQGAKGWQSLQKTIDYIPDNIFTIADAKRGDIGNTSKMYAKTFFENMSFDSVTVAPYMGEDSITPFLSFENKWVIVLALTSNAGAKDFQFTVSEEKHLFEKVMHKTQEWCSPDQLMFVVGATRGSDIDIARQAAPQNFFLVPGVGKQGGSLEDVVNYGMIDDCGLLVNSSRGIIYASSDENFASMASTKAKELQQQMAEQLIKHGIVR